LAGLPVQGSIRISPRQQVDIPANDSGPQWLIRTAASATNGTLRLFPAFDVSAASPQRALRVD
jgi:hypothetical protein